MISHIVSCINWHLRRSSFFEGYCCLSQILETEEKRRPCTAHALNPSIFNLGKVFLYAIKALHFTSPSFAHFDSLVQNMGFPYLQRRSELVSSIMRMAQTFGLRQEVAHDAILLMDRAMSTSLQVPLARHKALIWGILCELVGCSSSGSQGFEAPLEVLGARPANANLDPKIKFSL